MTKFKLDKWLDKVDRSMAWVSRMTDIDHATLSRANNGVQPLGIGACEKIHRLTNGEVSLKHLNPKLYKKYKNYKCLEA